MSSQPNNIPQLAECTPTLFYHIRISKDIANQTNNYLKFVNDNFLRWIVVRENDDDAEHRVHLHVHGESVHKRSTFRRKWDSVFPDVKGNRDFAIKDEKNAQPPDEKGYVYVCKGTGPDWDCPEQKPEVLSSTFSESQIQENHRIYWSEWKKSVKGDVITVDISESLKTIVKETKQKTKNWTQKVIYEIQEEYEDTSTWRLNDHTINIITRFMLSRMAKDGKALDGTIFRRLFYAIWNGIARAAARDELIAHYSNLILNDIR
ncbi:hypothetical protein [Shewanella sp.]|uniref:hypothetical protein n=1 Tax=Shewanella sp. TaxID=50422 RepID=UPI004047487E